MPLKCIDGDKEIYAFDYESDGDWAELREINATQKHLSMPCCGAGVTLRTSSLGTRHFAHARRGECATAPESAEHLLAKVAIIEAIKATEWLALPEQGGVSPLGNAWRADVLAIKGNVKIAFEVQLSRQTARDTELRQSIYKESGVRGLWLFKQPDFPSNSEIPGFKVSFDTHSKSFMVSVPSSLRDSESLRRYSRGELRDDAHWGQHIPLKDFIVGALSGRLRISPFVGAEFVGSELPIDILGVNLLCYRCRNKIKAIMGLSLRVGHVIQAHPDVKFSLCGIARAFPDGTTEIMRMLPKEILRAHGVGEIKPGRSLLTGETCILNHCIHCHAMQWPTFENDHFANDQGWHIGSFPLFGISAMIPPKWASLLSDREKRWWLSSSNDK